MEIVKRGKIPPIVKRKKKCRNCKSELIYTDEDVRFTTDIEYYPYEYFECPVCGEELYPSLFDKRVKND